MRTRAGRLLYGDIMSVKKKIIVYVVVFVIFYFIYFFVIAKIAEAHVCLVPQGMCATKGCAALASEDDLNLPVSHTDGDTTKISIMHQQSSPTSPSELVLDVCYEAHSGEAVGAYNVDLVPTGLLAPTRCVWDCANTPSSCTVGSGGGGTECDSLSESCEVWHGLDRVNGGLLGSTVCSVDRIDASYITLETSVPDWYPKENVVLARLTFAGSAKQTAIINDTPPNYGITADNIATPVLGNDMLTTDFGGFLITGDLYQLEVQTVWQSVAVYPPTSGSITCTPVDPSECPVSDGVSIDGAFAMSWAEPSPACDTPDLCSTVNYRVYRGGTKDDGGQPVAGCIDTASTSCEETVTDAISEFPATVSYYVYTSIPDVGDSTSYLNLNVSCQCVPDFSLLPGWNLITLSINPSDGATSTIFAGYDVTLYTFVDGEFIGGDDPSFGTLSTGNAYWVHSELGVSSISVSGTDVVDATYEISLSQGWNDFGSPYGDWLPWSDANISVQDGAAAPVALSLATSLVNTTVYKFGTIEDSYESVVAGSGKMLYPWKGYWIKALKDCTLIIGKP